MRQDTHFKTNYNQNMEKNGDNKINKNEEMETQNTWSFNR